MTYDVIVAGGGHAGLEAALVSARFGAETLLITQNIETIGALSCNPSFGGPAKGGLVREVDALGGFCGQMADLAARQCRILGESKGPAARSTRVVVDRETYRLGAVQKARQQKGLTVIAGEASEIITQAGQAVGLKLSDGRIFTAGAITLAGGTFWRGLIHHGRQSLPGGRLGENPANNISLSLAALGHRLGRLSTCTAPRLKAETIDLTHLQEQPGQSEAPPFSTLHDHCHNDASCWLTWTTPETHRLVAEGLGDSIFHSDRETGTSPRYCPSLEDKVHHYPDRERHKVFLEPDGPGLIFPSGIPTGLTPLVQAAFIRTMPGLEQAELAWPGYAIEYDYLNPLDLNPALESLLVKNLFLAGQINGTSGYEEAAAQGLLAGLNAARRAGGSDPIILQRSQALTGVMADDLTGRGVTEPYRLFSSRAEWRLLLREDNADLRLSPLAEKLGLLDGERLARFHSKKTALEVGRRLLEETRLTPAQSRTLARPDLETTETIPAAVLLRRPQATLNDLIPLIPQLGELEPKAQASLEIETKFAGYLKRQEEEVARLKREEEMPLPSDWDYLALTGLTAEVKQTLASHRPATLGQAGRLPGMTPAALTVLAVLLKGHSKS